MASDNRGEQREDEVPSLARVDAARMQARIAAFAMLDGMKDATQAQKTLRLSLIGFGNAEIAMMLQTTTAVIAQNLYAQRKAAAKRAKSKPAATGDIS